MRHMQECCLHVVDLHLRVHATAFLRAAVPRAVPLQDWHVSVAADVRVRARSVVCVCTDHSSCAAACWVVWLMLADCFIVRNRVCARAGGAREARRQLSAPTADPLAHNCRLTPSTTMAASARHTRGIVCPTVPRACRRRHRHAHARDELGGGRGRAANSGNTATHTCRS